MRALCLLGAGAQPWSTSICSTRQDRLAYASTVAIYVYMREGAAREWRLKCILTEPGTAITTLAWHPVRPQLLASSTSDLRVCVWCIVQQRIIASVFSPSEASLLDWNPFERDLVSFIHDDGRLFLTWSAQVNNKHTSIYREHAPFSSPATCLQWHATQPGRLVFGHADGTLSFYAPEGRVQLHTRVSGGDIDGEVRDVQWDVLSEDYLLVAHSGGSLRLISAQGVTTLTTFRHPAACRAHCIAWLPECPGMFITGDDESGVIRVWTVGRESALENRSLQSSGIRALSVVDSKHTQDSARDQVTCLAQASLACVFSDGGLGIYNLRRATWELHKEAGHIETVFTCAFRPDDSDTLATGSFDGTVKFWSCSGGEVSLQASTPGAETIIYSVSWAPAPLSMLAAATARNGVLLIDTKKTRVAHRVKSHGDGVSVFCVAWCQADARRLASGGADGSCIVTQHRGELEVQRCSHPASVFGCDWQGRDLLATACEDGNVRVFKITCNNYEIPVILSGHTAKVFSVRWNPALTGVLCSGSDDGTVRVWSFDSRECIRELTGHTGPVRGLGWSPALPHLLTSGSWDFTLRVWDARSGTCLTVQRDHGADVYGLSVHPLRPLLLASCSRDSTVRLWTLAPLVAKLTMTALIKSRSLDMLLSDDFRLNVDWTVRLCGPVATHLRTILAKEDLNEVQKFIIVIDTLNGDPSVRNLWDLLKVQQGVKEMSQLSRHYTRGIVHASHVTTCQLADGTRRELRAGAGTRGEAELKDAASSFLRAGALRRYCELMAKLGHWDKALSVAPGVSLRYWRHLNTRRVSELYLSESEQVLPHALAQGDIEGVVKFYATRGQLQEAFTFSALSGTRREVSEDNEDDSSVQTPCQVSPLVCASARALAERQLQAGFAVRAACTLLAVDDVDGAMQILLRGHEIELVLVLGRVLDKMSECRVHRALSLLALRARRLNEWRLAVELLTEIDNPKVQRQEVLRLLVQFSGPDAERVQLHRLINLPEPGKCSPQADTPPNEAVRLHLASGETLEALELGVVIIPELLQPGNSWDPEEALRLITLLQETGSKSTQLRLLSAYVGCIFAIRRRYPALLQPLIDHAKELLRELGGVSCGLRDENLQGLKENDAFLSQIREVSEPDPDRGTVYVSGCQMPAHSSLRRCLLTSVPIRGPYESLDDTEENCMALGDAIMWAKVGAMSPIGAMLMNPF